MANYMIVKNILEGSVKNGKIQKIELGTHKGCGMLMQIHVELRKLYENGFFMRSVTPDTIADRKKRKMATVMIFKNGKRSALGFEYTLQNKKIDFSNIDVKPIEDNVCPHCGSEDCLDYDSIESECNSANQEVSCSNCDCRWFNVYKFTGVQICD